MSMDTIALIAPPWPLFNRPSIQLAALKASLRQQEPEIKVHSLHPYLQLAADLGLECYHEISQSSWMAESIGAGILFPELKGRCDRLFSRIIKKRASHRGSGKSISPRPVREVMAKTIDAFVGHYDWRGCRLIGITVCLNQLCASLLIAKKIKDLAPSVPIVIGGASCAGQLGPSLLEAFPQIDYTINGEGERPLLGLLHYIQGKRDALPRAVSGRVEKTGPHPDDMGKDQVPDLDSLPIPNFDDYFRQLGQILGERRFSPVLPIEFSRGCWWRRCNFCNLNLQWSGYRAKSLKRMVSEIDYLSRHYGVLDFAFMDNVLPRRYAARLFRLLADHDRDYCIFAELRAVHSRDELATMARGGLKDIQVGIESLSTSLLRRINKGVRAIDNIAIMRHAEEVGLSLEGNLIIHFPGSTEEEVQQTIEALDFVWPFRPLNTVSFWLGLGSPVEQRPSDFGVSGIRPHSFFASLFPEEIYSRLSSLILSYRGDRELQYRRWRRVEKKVREWHLLRKKMGIDTRLLTYRDGGDYLIITQRLPEGKVLSHRLRGLSRRLYLYCITPRTLASVYDQATGQTHEQVRDFIRGLVDKRLVFQEGDRIISLAIHVGKSIRP